MSPNDMELTQGGGGEGGEIFSSSGKNAIFSNSDELLSKSEIEEVFKAL